LGAAKDPGLATQVGRASGAELTGLGFTVVMAPDADVTSPADTAIGVRSPGSDPARVSQVARGYVTGYR
ncbi:glycoside hydrolase family 3 N-terminal domain-containing protein, partial [Acinetobacter sp. 163]|nr:glycoside hydrolase family 3 N-terminal domain-containing protein [Acinetobacter sp. 163]